MPHDRKALIKERLNKQYQAKQDSKSTPARVYQALKKEILPRVQTDLKPQEQKSYGQFIQELNRTAPEFIANFDKNLERAKKAECTFDEALQLVKSKKYAPAQLMLQEAARMADAALKNDLSIRIRRFIVKYALANHDLASAMLQSHNLKALVVLPSFALKTHPDLHDLLGSKLTAGHVQEIYLILALMGLYQGEFVDSIDYFNKLDSVRDVVKEKWLLDEIDCARTTLIIIQAYLPKINRKDLKFGLQNISLMLLMLEREGDLYIEQLNLDDFYKCLHDLRKLTTTFALEHRFKAEDKGNQYRLCYLEFKQQQAEIYLHWGETFLKQLEKAEISAAYFSSYQECGCELLSKALTYAKETNNAKLIYLAASYLVNYSALELTQDDEHSANYRIYLCFRDQAAAQLTKKKPSKQITAPSLLKAGSAPSSEPDQTEPNKAAPNPAELNTLQIYQDWKHEYESAVALILGNEVDAVSQQLEQLLKKYPDDLFKQASIHFGYADAYHFNAQQILPSINALEQALAATAQVDKDKRKYHWIDLEIRFRAINSVLPVHNEHLEEALKHSQRSAELCSKIFTQKLIQAEDIEYKDLKEITSSVTDTIYQVKQSLSEIRQTLNSFLSEMETKKDYLISIKKYGTGPKRRSTGDLVDACSDQDAYLDRLEKNSNALINATDDLAEKVVQQENILQDKRRGIFYTSRAKKVAAQLDAYAEARDYYLQAITAFQRAQMTYLKAKAEWQLARVMIKQVNSIFIVDEKAALIEDALCYLFRAKRTYKPLNKEHQFDKAIGDIESDIHHLMQTQSTLTILPEVKTEAVEPQEVKVCRPG